MGAVWSLFLFRRHDSEPSDTPIVDLQNTTVQTPSGTQLHHRAPQNAAEEESGTLQL